MTTPHDKELAAQKQREAEEAIQRAMDLKKQKQLNQLRNRLMNKRKKVMPLSDTWPTYMAVVKILGNF